MTLNIFSFQRAFTAKQRMALAASNCDSTLCAIEAKDILDCLHLGLACEGIEDGETENSTLPVDEFIFSCKTILQKLSNEVENTQVTIPLSNNNGICLKEENGSIKMKMDGKQVMLPNLTIQNLYKNLVLDIQNNPDLYGKELTNYTNNLKRGEELFPAYN